MNNTRSISQSPNTNTKHTRNTKQSFAQQQQQQLLFGCCCCCLLLVVVVLLLRGLLLLSVCARVVVQQNSSIILLLYSQYYSMILLYVLYWYCFLSGSTVVGLQCFYVHAAPQHTDCNAHTAINRCCTLYRQDCTHPNADGTVHRSALCSSYCIHPTMSTLAVFVVLVTPPPLRPFVYPMKKKERFLLVFVIYWSKDWAPLDHFLFSCFAPRALALSSSPSLGFGSAWHPMVMCYRVTASFSFVRLPRFWSFL